MADRAPSTTRRALLGAAASLPVLVLAPAQAGQSPAAAPVDRALWDERLARYHRLAGRAKAAAETGWFRAANARYYREAADPSVDHKAAFARLDRAEDLYWRRCTKPVQAAAVALILTLVPDLEALRTKIALIRTHELQELDCTTRNCFETLEEDVTGLLRRRGATAAAQYGAPSAV